MATRRKLDIGKMTDAELESAVLAYKDAKESEKAVKKAVSDYGTQIKEVIVLLAFVWLGKGVTPEVFA